MIGKRIDAIGEQCDLYFCRTRIAGMPGILRDYCLLGFFIYHDVC